MEITRKCDRCGKPLPESRLRYANSRFCSEDCRWRAYHHKHKAKLSAYQKEWIKSHPENAKAWREKNKEKRRIWLKAWKARNPERVKELQKLSAQRCKKQAAIRRARWLEKYPERMKESRRKWKQENPDKRAANVRSRQLIKARAEPSWLSKEQKRKMIEFYKEAALLTKEKGIQHEVDHIVPIRGKQVCGLHVPWNLQVLTSEENRRKSARC